jgi:anti-sigma factor RsiW
MNDDERDELIAYLDGELSATEAQTVEKRLNADPKYRAEAEALRKTYNLLDYLPKPEPTANFTNRTLSRVSGARPTIPATISGGLWRRWALGSGWVAAVVLAGVVGYFGIGRLPSLEKGSGELAPDQEQQMVRDLRLLEHLGHYQHVPDIHFLNELDVPDLFADDLGY